METPLNVEKITWIHRQRSSYSSWYVHLDGTMGSSYLSLNDGEEVQSIWHAFLALPAVHLFERGRDAIAYNFAQIEQAVVSGQWGCFVFPKKSTFDYRSETLQPLREGALDLALPAYRLWLRAQPVGEHSFQPCCFLTVTLPTEQQEQAGARLRELFPGISVDEEDDGGCTYRLTFDLDTWLDEAQLMFLGLCEHMIYIPGGAQREGREEGEQVKFLAPLLSLEAHPGWGQGAKREPPYVRTRRLLALGFVLSLDRLLSIAIATLLWRLWRHAQRCSQMTGSGRRVRLEREER